MTSFRLNSFGLIVTATLIWPQTTAAHGDLPFTREVFLQDGQLVGGAANYGLLSLDAGQSLWTTEELIGSEPRLYHRLPDGRTLAAGFMGLSITGNFGCTWTEIPDLGDYVVSALIPDPTNPLSLFLVTSSRNVENRVFHSPDGGTTWEQLGANFQGISLKSVLVSPGGQKLWVQGHKQDDWSVMLFKFSVDNRQWEQLELETEQYKKFSLLELSSVGESTQMVIGAQTQSGLGLVLVSKDALESVVEIGRLGEVSITDYAQINDFTFVTAKTWDNKTTLWRSNAGESFRTVDGPTLCLTPGPTNTLWGCGDIQSNGHFLRTNDGESWESVAPFPNSCPLTCSPDTPGAELNPLAAKEMVKFGVGTNCDPPPQELSPSEVTKSGCQNLSAAGPSLHWVFLFGFICWLRKKHISTKAEIH